ncbi:unnamed protein product [Anisakis simplex]|uniref:WD_REPEATS_REGION domain-containing protein n=1 Tax=Anisakis simplex TaxID=6269 RepID=A0A0M3JVU7_ANISI|nr:unnamed protein product [Anisakis simplex]
MSTKNRLKSKDNDRENRSSKSDKKSTKEKRDRSATKSRHSSKEAVRHDDSDKRHKKSSSDDKSDKKSSSNNKDDGRSGKDKRHSSSTRRHESKGSLRDTAENISTHDSKRTRHSEDDFEDYSEDFEEDTEDDTNNETLIPQRSNENDADSKGTLEGKTDDEIKQKYGESPMLKRILNRPPDLVVEADRANTTARKRTTTSPRISSAQRKIDFTNATVTSVEPSAEMSQRYEMLKDLIGLELVYFDFLELKPVQTQTGDDNLSREIQTEEIECETKWTQYPPVDEIGWGSVINPNASKVIDFNKEDSDLARFKQNHLQSERLRKFIAVSSKVIIDLISSPSDQQTLSPMKHRSKMTFSSGYNVFSIEGLASDSKVTCVRQSGNRLLVAFFIRESLAQNIVRKSLAVEYKCTRPEAPERIMLCEGEVCCCCYSPDGSSAIFFGLNDGSCLAFDLHEPSSFYSTTLPWPDSTKQYCLQTPAYDTSFRSVSLKDDCETHEQAPIVDMCSIGDDAENNIDGSYQLITINQLGTIIIWAIISGSTSNWDIDLGLRPGATLKMNESDVIKPDRVIMDNSTFQPALIANTMLTNPKNKNQFLVGTDAGFILNLVRFKGIAYSGPRIYTNNYALRLNIIDETDPMSAWLFIITVPDKSDEVLCEKLSPFDSSILFAGLSSGCVALYKLQQPEPVIVLRPPNSSRKPVMHIECSPRYQSVFYSIHGGMHLLVWDIATGKSPIAVCDLLSEFHASVLCTTVWSQKSRRGTDETVLPFLALGFSNGQLHVHALEKMSKSQTQSSIVELVQTLNNKL